DVLSRAHSNDETEGDGRAIWQRHVEPSRVDADRVVAHLALISLLEDRDPPSALTSFSVEDSQRRMADRGGLRGVAGQVTLVHRRTGRRTAHVYAAIHLGGLEFFGATRPADPEQDSAVFAELSEAIESGARVTTLLRL